MPPPLQRKRNKCQFHGKSSLAKVKDKYTKFKYKFKGDPDEHVN